MLFMHNCTKISCRTLTKLVMLSGMWQIVFFVIQRYVSCKSNSVFFDGLLSLRPQFWPVSCVNTWLCLHASQWNKRNCNICFRRTKQERTLCSGHFMERRSHSWLILMLRFYQEQTRHMSMQPCILIMRTVSTF